jgi:hypothetical protein
MLCTLVSTSALISATATGVTKQALSAKNNLVVAFNTVLAK